MMQAFVRSFVATCLVAMPLLAHAADRPEDATYPRSGQSLADIIAAMPKGLKRAEGPPLVTAIEAAKAAVSTCAAAGAKVSVLVADSVGEPVVMLSGDGAGVRSRLIAESKVAAVIRFGMPSDQAAEKARTDHSIAAAAQADGNIGMLRGGGFPIIRNGHVIGAIGTSGASIYGVRDMDETCSQVALRILQAP